MAGAYVGARDLATADKMVFEPLPGCRPREVADEHTAVLLTVSALALCAVLTCARMFVKTRKAAVLDKEEERFSEKEVLGHGSMARGLGGGVCRGSKVT